MPEVSDRNPVMGSSSELAERTTPPVSVNWHVWPRCNYACGFCFTTFRDIPRALPKKDALRIPALLRAAGTEKLTFVGGEPTLCPYLPELVRTSKDEGLTTMVVTNGYLLADGYLDRIRDAADWIGLSLESASNEIEKRLGRGNGDHVDRVLLAARKTRAAGIRLKVNTTVTALTWREDLHDVILTIEPERWKVFQALWIRGENDAFMARHAVTPEQFRAFVARHVDLHPVVEDNELMRGSYVMLDPLGRFFQDSRGYYEYSDPILDVGVMPALSQVGWDTEKFVRRGGLYGWGPAKRGV